MSSQTPPALPALSLATPSTCILDNFKLSLAEHVAKVLGVELQAAYEAVESGKVGKGTAGDFTVAVPRFRLKGDVIALSKRLVDEVRFALPTLAILQPIPSPREHVDGVQECTRVYRGTHEACCIVTRSNTDRYQNRQLPPNGYYIASGLARGAFVNFTANTQTLTQAVLTQVNDLTWLQPEVPSLDSLSLDAPAVPAVEKKKTAGGERVTREKKVIIKRGYGMNMDGAGKSIIVEFSSPNISKVFHVVRCRIDSSAAELHADFTVCHRAGSSTIHDHWCFPR